MSQPQRNAIYAGREFVNAAVQLFRDKATLPHQTKDFRLRSDTPMAVTNGELFYDGVPVIHDPRLDTIGESKSCFVVPESLLMRATRDRLCEELDRFVHMQQVAKIVTPPVEIQPWAREDRLKFEQAKPYDIVEVMHRARLSGKDTVEQQRAARALLSDPDGLLG